MTTAIRAFSLALATGAVIGQAPTHVPADAFDVPDGLEVTVWAKAPLLQNPTNMDVDHLGRIWVTEGVNYRGKAKRRPEGDRVVVLEDKDGDGVAETSTVFVQEPFLVSPLGVAVFDNVVVVSQPPEMLVTCGEEPRGFRQRAPGGDWARPCPWVLLRAKKGLIGNSLFK